MRKPLLILIILAVPCTGVQAQAGLISIFSDTLMTACCADMAEWEIADLHAALTAGQDLTIRNLTQGSTFSLTYDLTERQVAIILAGGLLNHI